MKANYYKPEQNAQRLIDKIDFMLNDINNLDGEINDRTFDFQTLLWHFRKKLEQV